MVADDVRVKVCGIVSPDTVKKVDGMVSYVGFVSSKRGASPRSLPLETISQLASHFSLSKTVAVLHGYRLDEIASAMTAPGIEVFQIHDPLDTDSIMLLSRAAESLGVKIAPVVEWRGFEWVPTDPCELYSSIRGSRGIEYILVDLPKSGGVTGRAYSIPLAELREAVECVEVLGIAGGITPGNVCAVAKLKPYLIDVSRGVEAGRPGFKDQGLILKLLYNARRCSEL